MAWVAIGVFLILEGLEYLGAAVWNKRIIQGICLIVAGLLFAWFRG